MTSAPLHIFLLILISSATNFQQATISTNQAINYFTYQTQNTQLPKPNNPTIKMQFTIATVLSLLTIAIAAPTYGERQVPYTPCSGLYGTAQCCATDVLGIADLDCANPPETVANATHFESTCASIGQRARCCVLPILGQDILCQTPAGL